MGRGALRDAIGRDAPPPARRDVLTSVSRALDVLEVVASSPRPLPAKAVAQQLGISLGSSYHVLHTLEHAGYVVRLGQGCYGLGSKVPALYRLFRDQLDLLPALRPLLGELAERSDEDAYLAVFRGGEIVIADVVEGSTDLHIDGLGVGFSRVAHTTALGKVLLAASSDEDLDGYLGEHELQSFTQRTLTRRRHIKRHLHTVHDLGVGKDLEELADGCCCVAVPVLDAAGAPVAAIGLSTPAPRWRREQANLVAMCVEIGVRASTLISREPSSGGASRPSA